VSFWGAIGGLLVAAGTLVIAAVAVFQETIRGWFYCPRFQVSIKTEPPDCVAVPFTTKEGTFLSNAIYLRLWIENVGNATARHAEVYAKELRRQRADGKCERVDAFSPMNLKWSNVVGPFFPRIAPNMGKHCDMAHIAEPALRRALGEESPRLALNDQQTSLAFDLIAPPNHKGHIIGPGEYRLDILVAAENARPHKETIAISLRGTWDEDERRMLSDGIGVVVETSKH
jgi:hypothetical protein